MPDDVGMTDIELLDAGDGARLERFGPLVVDRPAPGALEPRRDPDAWRGADVRFDRERGWQRRPGVTVPNDWSVSMSGITLGLRPTDAGQVGVFPEHAAGLPWLTEQVARRSGGGAPPAVLHLFAYTGLVTLALARAGAAVAHVDASRPSVAWARGNAERNALGGAPIRWLVDDVRAFVSREIRRGRRYDGVVLDPPTYGHGGSGQPWRIDGDLPPLLVDVGRLLVPDGFILLTAHAPDTSPERLGELVGRFRGRVTTGALALDARSGARLVLGAYARLDGAS